MDIIIDLDGTICTEEKTFEHFKAKPMLGVREALVSLKNKGHKIIIYTGRCWGEYELTKNWLERHEITYDLLILGKPIGDLWIDDRAIKYNTWKDITDKHG